ncbi:hypothetical protein L484_002585 [Morus notabilis]|uniref:Uncharacterized protein n=1 Tax=Morus notabilis TaxID=981085 RepID=W9SNM5_9ROSA|nr:hypothetical protein L484_002585 [Morus notabilis]
MTSIAGGSAIPASQDCGELHSRSQTKSGEVPIRRRLARRRVEHLLVAFLSSTVVFGRTIGEEESATGHDKSVTNCSRRSDPEKRDSDLVMVTDPAKREVRPRDGHRSSEERSPISRWSQIRRRENSNSKGEPLANHIGTRTVASEA